MEVLGIDVGGSGIKGAPVDIEKGVLLEERFRIPTPQPATPKAVAETVNQIKEKFKWKGEIGCGFPAVVRRGIVKTASNIDKSWIGTHAGELFSEVTGCPTLLVNDADAAGMAEMSFGIGRDRKGTVIMITVGTGIGSAIFTHGKLLPNTEFGHIILKGTVAEQIASDAARKREDLKWKEWGVRFDHYLNRMEFLFSPDLFIIGGGASKKFEKYIKFLNVEAEVQAAKLKNEAGIIGAALCTHYL
jgi:polyphosphate glucokinase